MEDRELRKLVEDELEWQPSIDASRIGVTVKDGIVHLTGHVPHYAQKVAAENAVKRMKGVRGYVEDLEIVSEQAKDSDEAIARRVVTLLDWDVTLPHEGIKVNVEGGYVTLSGEVEWAYQRSAAERGIRRLAGVRGLVNAIHVKPRVHAVDIKRRIERALERQADIEANRISVSVEGGKVKLAGKVRAWFERDIAERAAWSAPGVEAVEDRVTVGL